MLSNSGPDSRSSPSWSPARPSGTSLPTVDGLLAVIWVSTFLIQVPLHGRLTRGFDATRHSALVRSNWIRTVAWSARGALLAWMLLGLLPRTAT